MTIFSLLLVLPLMFGLSSCGKPDQVEPGSKTNSPPVVRSVTILPENPTREKDLAVTVQGEDRDNDPITYIYQWVKNDAEMVGENSNVLKSGTFKKGDTLLVKVIPHDGKTEGKPFLSKPVRVLNSPPIVQEVRIEPKIASVSEDLRVIVKGFDPDGDFIYYGYRWEKNGIIMPEEGKEILTRNKYKKGDSIAVTVIPDDRDVIGAPKKSDAVVISNSPPLIISSPPESIQGSKYIYQVRANDPDNDPVTFVLKSGPKGMEIDKNTGLILWEIRKEDKGAYQVEIEAFDNEGARSTQRYLLTVEFRPQ